MKHLIAPSFNECLKQLPQNIQKLATKNLTLLKNDEKYPSLHFKKVGIYWSIRIGQNYRALGIAQDDNLVWFWIGTHAEYDKRIK